MAHVESEITVKSILRDFYDIALEKRRRNNGVDYVYANPFLEVISHKALDMSCLYVHGSEPGCLIGTWLYNKGVSLIDLSVHEGAIVGDLVRVFFPEVSDDVVDVVTQIQVCQDARIGWLSLVKHVIADNGLAVSDLTLTPPCDRFES